MEEEKAAAYFGELSRKGEGAARFKQALGFSSSTSIPPKPKSSASALFSTFVRGSSPTAEPPDEPHHREQAQIGTIQNNLKRDRHHHDRRRSPSPSPHRDRRRRSSSDRDDRHSGDRRSRSFSRERRRESDGRGSSHRRRRSRDRSEDSSSSRSRRRSRSRSPLMDSGGEDRERRGDHVKETGGEKHKSSRNKSGGGVDYSQVIEGYPKMTPAERVEAKMKLQLSETDIMSHPQFDAEARVEATEDPSHSRLYGFGPKEDLRSITGTHDSSFSCTSAYRGDGSSHQVHTKEKDLEMQRKMQEIEEEIRLQRQYISEIRQMQATKQDNFKREVTRRTRDILIKLGFTPRPPPSSGGAS